MKEGQFDTCRALRKRGAFSPMRAVLAMACVLVIARYALPSVAAATALKEAKVEIYSFKDVKFVSLEHVFGGGFALLPIGQSEITEAFSLPGPDQLDHTVIEAAVASCKAEDKYKSCEWMDQPPYNGLYYPMGYQTAVAIESGDVEDKRKLELTLELRSKTATGMTDLDLPWRMRVYQQEIGKYSAPVVSFSDVTTTNYGSWNLLIYLPDEWDSERWPMQLVVTVRALPDMCIMKVEYSGDFEGVDYGDIAFYNDFLKEGNPYKDQGGVARASGSAADPSAQATLDVLLEMTGVYNSEPEMNFTEEEVSGVVFDPFSPESLAGEQPPPAEVTESEQRAQIQAFKKWVGGADELPPGGELETFGLTLVGRKRNTGVANLVNAAVLEVGFRGEGTIGSLFSEGKYKKQGKRYISRLDFSPGGLHGQGSGAPWFRWREGEIGSVEYMFNETPEDGEGRLEGKIKAELISSNHRQPDGRYSRITLKAKFSAEETQLGCEFKGKQ